MDILREEIAAIPAEELDAFELELDRLLGAYDCLNIIGIGTWYHDDQHPGELQKNYDARRPGEERPAFIRVPDKVVLPMNPLGEIKVYANPCDPETSGRLFDFANAFAGAYYGYFGTRNADYYYSTVLQYVAQDSELRQRIDMALMDRRWVNTWSTEVNNIVLDGAYSNGDGSYDIIITSDIHEHADYWNYEAPGTTLRITAVEAPGTPYGYLATATF